MELTGSAGEGAQLRHAVAAAPGLGDEYLRPLLDGITDHGIFMLDPAGRVLTWNLGAERLVGHSAQEALGQHVSVVYPAEAIAERQPERALAEAAATGRCEDEGWRVRKDGARFWANVVISRVTDDRGAIVGFANVMRDFTARKQLERQLEDENRLLEDKTRLFEAIFDCIGDGITACGKDGQFLFMNRASRELAGTAHGSAHTVAESISRYGIFMEDGVTPFPVGQSTLLQALAGVSSDNVQAVMRNPAHPDGVDLDVTTRPVRNRRGEIVAAVVIAHDVTRRKRAERALKRQETLLRSVLDCVAETVSVFDMDGKLILANPAFLDLVGPTVEMAPGVTERLKIYGLFLPDGVTRLPLDDAPAMRATRGETVNDVEVVVRSARHPAGVLMSTNARPLVDPAGGLVGAVVTGRDVTARREAERKLVEQAELLSTILACAAEGIVVYDPEGRIVLTNAAADSVMGSSRRSTTLEERTRDVSAWTLEGKRLELRDLPVARALRGEAVDDVELLVRLPGSGEHCPVSSSGRPMVDGQGRIVGAVISFRDITARRRAEAEKEALLAELKRSNDELAQFAYAASHDLRAPLRGLDSLARWLERDLQAHFSAENAEQMRLLRNRVARMERLLHDLLEYSRVGQQAAEVSQIEIDRVLAEVLELCAPPPGFQVATRVDVPRLTTAALPLERALLNLVANAIKHHDRPDGQIRLSVRDAGDAVEFEVADDGPGIPARAQQRVFQMFQTLRPRDEAEGSGMGLAFVKKLAEHAGGSIRLESEGRGARFVLAWPKVYGRGRAAPVV